MSEIYSTGAIQKEPGRLHEESVRFLQIGCGLADFKPPTGRQRFSVVENPRLKIATEKNGGLAEAVARGKYNWGIVGLDTVEDLPDELRDNVMVVRRLGFQSCQYRFGLSPSALLAEGGASLTPEIRGILNSLGSTRIVGDLTPDVRDIIDSLGPRTLNDLRPRRRIATKHDNYLRRIVRQRDLELEVVHDSTPEIAPEFRGIGVVADIVRSGETFDDHAIFWRGREVLLESEAVLIKVKKLPWGRAFIFNYKLMPRVDEALENPGRWLNPDIPSSSKDVTPEDLTKRPRRRIWPFGRMDSGGSQGGATTSSTLPVALMTALLTLTTPFKK